MKLYQLISLAFTVSILFFSSSMAKPSGEVEETSFEVKGVCGMCKERIENAALIKGVKKVEWDKDTQLLNIIYNPKKTDIDKVQKSLAEAGHSTEKYPAIEKAYKKLPACCKYDDNVEVH